MENFWGDILGVNHKNLSLQRETQTVAGIFWRTRSCGGDISRIWNLQGRLAGWKLTQHFFIFPKICLFRLWTLIGKLDGIFPDNDMVHTHQSRPSFTLPILRWTDTQLRLLPYALWFNPGKQWKTERQKILVNTTKPPNINRKTWGSHRRDGRWLTWDLCLNGAGELGSALRPAQVSHDCMSCKIF